MGAVIHWMKKKAARERIAAARAIGLNKGLDDLRNYLESEKFHNDTTVQVTDVLLRLDAARNLADHYESEATLAEIKKGNL
jgi:hypothetical protein